MDDIVIRIKRWRKVIGIWESDQSIDNFAAFGRPGFSVVLPIFVLSYPSVC